MGNGAWIRGKADKAIRIQGGQQFQVSRPEGVPPSNGLPVPNPGTTQQASHTVSGRQRTVGTSDHSVEPSGSDTVNFAPARGRSTLSPMRRAWPGDVPTLLHNPHFLIFQGDEPLTRVDRLNSGDPKVGGRPEPDLGARLLRAGMYAFTIRINMVRAGRGARATRGNERTLSRREFSARRRAT